MTRAEDRGRADEEVQRVPGRHLQLLAADPRQRRGGALGRQGGQLGQAVRQRPPGAGGDRAAGASTSSGRSGGSRTSACSTSWASPTWRSRSTARPAPGTAINVADVEAAVQVAIGGKAFSQMVEGEKLYDIILRLPGLAPRRPDRDQPDPGRHPGRRRQGRGAGSPWASSPRSTPTSRAPRTSTGRTTSATSRSSSASATATSPRRSQEAQQKVERPEDRRRAPAGLPDRVVGRVRPDAGGQRPADLDRPALDRPDHGAALHRVQLDQGRAAGDGQRRRRDDGRDLGPPAHRTRRSASRRRSGSSRSSAWPCRTACS